MKENSRTKFPLPMSPMTRLSMVFNEEMKRDTAGLLDSLKDKYIERARIAELKWHSMFRSLFFVDAALSFLISGHDFKIPIIDIRAIEIPSVVEAATIASAFCAVFLATQFVTWASYDTITRQFGNAAAGVKYSAGEKPGVHTVDSDFVAAAHAHTELALKLLRAEFNINSPDYYDPGKAFRIYSKTVYGLIGLLLVLFPLVHWLLTGLSLHATFSVHGLGIVTGIYFLVVFTMNLLAFLVAVGAYKDFYFSFDFSKTPWK
jgi:hypothetical protein